MKKSWVAYIIARVLVFALPLAVLLILNFNPYFATGVAAIVGLALSILFLSRWRSALSAEIFERVNNKKDDAAKSEDAIVDSLDGDA
jgi:L-lactate permease